MPQNKAIKTETIAVEPSVKIEFSEPQLFCSIRHISLLTQSRDRCTRGIRLSPLNEGISVLTPSRPEQPDFPFWVGNEQSENKDKGTIVFDLLGYPRVEATIPFMIKDWPITREALLYTVCEMVCRYFYEYEYTIGQNGRRIGEQDGDVRLKDVYIHALAAFDNNVWRPLLSYTP